MAEANIIVEAGPSGVTDITVVVPSGGRDEGLRLIQRALPAIRELSRDLRAAGSERAGDR
jgi:hypothetical protein